MDALNQPATYRNMMATTPRKRIIRQRNTWARKPKLVIAFFFIAWTDGYTGERVGETDILGHARRGPKGRNQKAITKQTKKEHMWLRSHNVGSIRSRDRREDALSRQAPRKRRRPTIVCH